MRAWRRFQALDEGQGPLRFKALLGGKRIAVLLVWKTRHPAWSNDAAPLMPTDDGIDCIYCGRHFHEGRDLAFHDCDGGPT